MRWIVAGHNTAPVSNRLEQPKNGTDGGAAAESRAESRRVLIVDDHRLFADAIQCALSEQGMETVEVVTRAADAVEAARQLRPDLVLMDVNLPDEDGIAAGTRILRELPTTNVIAVTASREPRAVTEAVRAGFAGYLTKDIPLSDFISSVLSGVDGRVVITRAVAPAAAGARSEEEKEARFLADQLTRREWEVLTLLVHGLRGTDIAERLSVSKNTARSHIQNVLTKLQVHSRLEAASLALRHDLVDPRGGRRLA